MARGSFVWTDSEVELLPNVALDYKASKAHENVDWESCKTKYVDMLALFLEKYPSETNEEFPHVKEDITQANLTTKMKAIRGKYRNAVDTGCRSGHRRVVLLYLELCEKAWGGSPATTTITSGIETNELEDSASPATSVSSSLDESAADVQEVDGSVALTPTVKQRRDLLQTRLQGHRHDRMKRKLPAEVQWLNAIEEDKQLKKKLVDIIETSENRAVDNLSKMTQTLDRLTASIADGFALLRQVVQPPHTPPPPPQPHYIMPFQGRGPYGQVYAHTPAPPPPPLTHSYDNRPPSAVPLSTVSLTDSAVEGMQGQLSYLQALNEDAQN
ncbi:uncharacterized protein LOC113745220 [Larimichthys crocea]|uniref:uncharacterized protein LOC113745220 n=1 Tax=Larimichthys crocea TaxID=215358 RepID=UPI000F5DADBC|nr:uncharacterized protein LOC113745220 [Larimichthys crocea]